MLLLVVGLCALFMIPLLIGMWGMYSSMFDEITVDDITYRFEDLEDGE